MVENKRLRSLEFWKISNHSTNRGKKRVPAILNEFEPIIFTYDMASFIAMNFDSY